MSESTLFLASLMGPVLLVLALSFALRQEEYMKWFKKIDKERPYLFLQGVVEMTTGLAVVLAHNLWQSPAEVFISLLGWGMLLEGSLTLVCSRTSIKKALTAFANKQLMFFLTLAMLALGGYLSWMAYLA